MEGDHIVHYVFKADLMSFYYLLDNLIGHQNQANGSKHTAV
jgi:hypothetical protein